MRWSRIAKLTMAMATVAAVLVGSVPAWHWLGTQRQERAQRPDPVLASPDETRSMLRAAIATLELKGLPPPPGLVGSADPERKKRLLVVDRSVCFDSISESGCSAHHGETLQYPELEVMAPLKLRRELVLANRASVLLSVEGVPETQVVKSEVIRAIFENGDWDHFYRRFPGTAGFTRVSQPVLSEDRERALLYVSHHCGGLCGSGTVLLLVRSGSTWSVVKRELLWIS